jgi:hypothetical protein
MDFSQLRALSARGFSNSQLHRDSVFGQPADEYRRDERRKVVIAIGSAA